MKRFLIRLAVFMLILVSGLTVYFLVINSYNISTIHNIKFDKGINKLIAGDSRTQYSINDKLLENSKNISQNSEGLLYTYFKLKILLTNNPQIDTIFLGVSYHTFSSYYIDIQNKPEVSSRYFFILSANEQLRLIFDTKNTFPLFQKSIVDGTRNWYYNTQDTAFLGGFDSYSSPVKISDELIEERIRFQFFDNNKEQELFDESIVYLGLIAEMCKDKNVKLIVLNTPMHKNYSNRVPAKFVNEYNRLIRKYDIEQFDFYGITLSDNDFLPDGDHLQESGAEITTIYLSDHINKRSPPLNR